MSYNEVHVYYTVLYRRNIPCQPTAVARRRPALGKGCKPAPQGRPKARAVGEHMYASTSKKARRAAPHSLSYCVEQNISSGVKH